MSNPQRGRVYRRCGCRDAAGRQLGARCPELAGGRHGRWASAVDLPSLDGRRRTMRRSGFASRTEAQAALGKVLGYERTGIVTDDKQTVADYLTTWLHDKASVLKPTTTARYHDYICKDLVPALGAIRLYALSHHHIALFIDNQLTAGRGPVTLRRCVATLSSALTDAVRQRRLAHNPARYARVPRPPKYEPTCWSPSEAARFLRYCHDHDDPLTDLFEVIIGTGLRKGEALALHWDDISLDDHVAFIRYTLSNINNTTPVLTAPKTKSSRTWIGLSDRVITALRHQRLRQPSDDLVFHRRDGKPLRPEYVLRHFRQLTDDAGLPRIRVHDLRHFAATTMLNSNVPLAVISRAMRHSTLSTTTEVYGHLLRHVAHDAVDVIANALNDADAA
ncbi:tyrosine recombinase XerC [Saccharothrix saharensis]|uniref:site-specific integrase n=1 Tax=Saccharothrix saharensis TaxID=571190 RepID=UPI0036792531